MSSFSFYLGFHAPVQHWNTSNVKTDTFVILSSHKNSDFQNVKCLQVSSSSCVYLTKHFLKSFGSMPGRDKCSKGRIWDGPSLYHLPALNMGPATPTSEVIQEIKRWGSVRVSMAGYVLQRDITSQAEIRIYILQVSTAQQIGFLHKLSSDQQHTTRCVSPEHVDSHSKSFQKVIP